jgi:hypothetical protein
MIAAMIRSRQQSLVGWTEVTYNDDGGSVPGNRRLPPAMKQQ